MQLAACKARVKRHEVEVRDKVRKLHSLSGRCTTADVTSPHAVRSIDGTRILFASLLISSLRNPVISNYQCAQAISNKQSEGESTADRIPLHGHAPVKIAAAAAAAAHLPASIYAIARHCNRLLYEWTRRQRFDKRPGTDKPLQYMPLSVDQPHQIRFPRVMSNEPRSEVGKLSE
ncbi:hypothetical protein ANO11243_083760 [Dothideomycetidae sp. 11243]|nr:hypothetical protein ANO11243_083760 [fungal sp. No.11243]